MKNILLLFFYFISHSAINAQLVIGEQLPDINLPNHLNKEVKITPKISKIILVDFWASWCAPCRKANKKLVSLHREFGSTKLEIVGISLDTDRSKWLRAIAKDNIQYTQLTDPHGFDSNSAQKFGVEALPASYLFDQTGKLIAINPTKQEIKKKLNYNKQ